MSDDELISAYLDGDLSLADQARVEGLIASQAAWRVLHDDLVALREEIASLPRFSAPAGLSSRILAAIAAQGPEEQQPAAETRPEIRPAASWYSPLIGLVGASAVAASLALALAAPQWFRGSGESNLAQHAPRGNDAQPAAPTVVQARGRKGEEAIPSSPPPPAADGLRKLAPDDTVVAGALPSGPAGAPAPEAADALREIGKLYRERDLRNNQVESFGQLGGGGPPAAKPADVQPPLAAKAAAVDALPAAELQKKQAAFASRAKELRETLAFRAERTIADDEGRPVTVLELTLPASLPAEKAIAKLVAQADATLVTHPARRQEWAGALRRSAQKGPAAAGALDGMEGLPAGDVLVLELDAARAERLVASLENRDEDASLYAKNVVPLNGPTVKLEQDRQFAPAPAAPAPPGEQPVPARGQDSLADKARFAESGEPAPAATAMVIRRDEAARLIAAAKGGRAGFGGEDRGGAGAGGNADPAGAVPAKPDADAKPGAGGDEKRLVLPRASVAAAHKPADRRRIVILLQVERDSNPARE